MDQDIIKAIGRPHLPGHMAFTVDATRIMNLHKYQPAIRYLPRRAHKAMVAEAFERGSLDALVFFLEEFKGSLLERERPKPSPSMEAQIIPGLNVFLNQLFPSRRFTPSWTFHTFGERYTSLHDAVVACDPLATIRYVVFELLDPVVSDDVIEALDTIPVDEMRHFFKWTLWAWLPPSARVIPTSKYTPDGRMVDY